METTLKYNLWALQRRKDSVKSRRRLFTLLSLICAHSCSFRLNPFAVGSRPTLGKCFIFHCRRKRLFKKIPYCFQYDAQIISFSINLTSKSFPLFLHSGIINKAYYLLKLFNSKTMSTVFKDLFQCFRQRSSVKSNLLAR